MTTTIQGQQTVFTSTEDIVNDLQQWNLIIYATSVQSTVLNSNRVKEGYLLAAHGQYHFNKVDTEYFEGGITFLSAIDEDVYCCFRLSQPIKQATKVDISSLDAIYLFELDFCYVFFTLLAICK